MQSARAIDFSVGLFILLGLGSVLFLVMQTLGADQINAGDSYVLQARFDQIGDLKLRAPVALAGVTIGRVSEITVDPVEFRAVVELRIDARIKNLPVDTYANIASKGLLGGKYIELSPGGNDEVLQDHDEIELTQSAVLLEDLIGKYMLGGNDE
jgi:phospholipid/cholesterol/gamma-HCH transport system substrate-binding protein